MKLFLIFIMFFLYSCSKPFENKRVGEKISIVEVKDERIRASLLKTSFSSVSLQKRGRSKSSTLSITELAKSDVLQLNGLTISATSVYLRDSVAFIGFQYVGDSYSGAVLIVNVSDPNNPVVKNLIEYQNADIRHLFFTRRNSVNYLFVGGASLEFENRPAFVVQITLDDHLEMNDPNAYKIYDLPSYGVTGFAQKGSSGNSLYVSSGYLNSSLSIIDIPNKVYTESVISVNHIRSVSYETSGIYLLTSTELKKYSKDDFSLISSINVKSDVSEDSKSSMNIYGSSIVLGVGANGTQIHSTSDLSLLDSVPQVDFTANSNSHPQLLKRFTVTNSSKVSDEYLFTASGGAGVHIYEYDSDVKSITASSVYAELGYFTVENGESVNSIDFDSGIMVVAAGSGGFYILSVNF